MVEHANAAFEGEPDLLGASCGVLSAECRVAALGDLSYLGKAAERVEQIEQAGVRRAKLAAQRVGRRAEQLGYLFRVLELTRHEHDKADVIASPSPCASGHL